MKSIMKTSKRKCWWRFASLALVLVFVVVLFKVERIEEVCAKTASSIRYDRYFSVFTTEKKLTRSWIEVSLTEEGIVLPDRDWKKTAGDTSTFFSATRSHGSAPLIYELRTIDLEWMHETFGSIETLKIAKMIAFGDSLEQKAAIKIIKSR